MQTFSVMGMVIYSAPQGEYDRRLVILTKEKGRITAFAKGARRPGSALLAASQPFTFAEFELYEGRTSYNVMSAEKAVYFAGLRDDLEGMYYGMYLCELTEALCAENVPEPELLKLLFQSMKALERKTVPNKLIRGIFELRAITISGEGPMMSSCIVCGKKQDLTHFDERRGGMLCSDCAAKEDSLLVSPLDPSLLYGMQFTKSQDIKSLYTFSLKDELIEKFSSLMADYIDRHVDKKLTGRKTIEELL